MNAVMQPLYWRLENEQNSEMDIVSVLMPQDDNSPDAIEFPVDVTCKPSRYHEGPIDLRWSDDDVQLFVSLLSKVMDMDESDIELDIEDGTVQGIIHLVATARFHTPWPGDELEGDDFITYREEIEVGDLVSLNTRYGFFSAVIVELDAIDATCVLLDDIVSPENEDEVLMPCHSLVMVNRVAVLSPEFSEGTEPEVIH